MSCIFYYSKYNELCTNYIQHFRRCSLIQNIKFVCIDNKQTSPDGTQYVLLENGRRMTLPLKLIKVPALLLLSEKGKLIFDQDIIRYFEPKAKQQTSEATKQKMEPVEFSFTGYGSIVSDKYSAIDSEQSQLNHYTSYMDTPLDHGFNQIPQTTQTLKGGYKHNDETAINNAYQQKMDELKKAREQDQPGRKPPMNATPDFSSPNWNKR